MKAGGDALRPELWVKCQHVAVLRQDLLKHRRARRCAVSDADLQHRQAPDRQHFLDHGPEREFVVGTEGDNDFGAGRFEQGRNVPGLQQVVDRAGLARQLRAPERELRLRNVRRQNGHGIVRPDAHGAKQVGRPVNLREQFGVAHGHGRLLQITAGQVAKRITVCKAPRRVGDQAVGSARRDRLLVRPALQRLNVGQPPKGGHGHCIRSALQASLFALGTARRLMWRQLGPGPAAASRCLSGCRASLPA